MTKATATTTAGVRGALWDPTQLPEGSRFEPALVPTADGAHCQGILAHRGHEKIAMMGMHPREYLPNNYMVPEVLKDNVAMWTQAPRMIGNDIRLEHETALLDVAAGVQHLRNLGYETIILAGMSGGASLFSFYLQQANLPAGERLAKTPAGKPTKLQKVELPLVDGVIFLSPHPGQGILLMNSMDPSVVDESDPMQSDETLNPFNADNGFAMPPESSSYDADFVSRYRAAQRARVARIDAWAQEQVSRRVAARKAFKETLDLEKLKAASYTPIITLWRTDADLRCFDLSLEPTDRAYGTLWGPNPMVSNYGSVGFARTCTPDSWLSTWSGLSSNAAMAKTAAGITQPSLVIRFSGDNSLFPSETAAIFDALASEDKSYEVLPGNHHGRPVRDGDPNGQALAGETMLAWLDKRFR
ncbi:MAG: alpha/beta hydrolase [Pseudomonadota bacterium]